jgi:beta-glucosidase
MKNKGMIKGLLAVLMLTVVNITSNAQENAAIESKINVLIKKMTLEEKVGMIHASSSFTSGGVKRLGIPEMTTSDGPHGVRVEHGRGWDVMKNVEDAGTYLPTGNTLAATWNPQLGYAFGTVLGSEAKYRGKDVILGPGINIIRTPLNGRNFEYLSEDPYLISKMVVGYIQGVQDQGISACVKHFAANNQETERNSINVEMSERALREIYLPGFKAAVTVGKVNTLMGAYNKFRGQFCTENEYLINKILKGEWGFKGVVMSDWGAVHNTLEALNNGTDLEMGTDLSMLPHPDYNKFFMADPAIALVKEGKVPVSVIDEKVRRILRVMYKTHMIDGKRAPGAYNTRPHQLTALKIAEEGIVLLKNQNHILPLSTAKVKTIAVIGENADRDNAYGGGSSQVKAKYEITPLHGLKNLVGDKVKLNYVQGYKIARGAQADPEMIKQAVDAASKADIAIVVGGWTHGYDYNVWDDNAYDAEGTDKPDMRMPFGQDELIKAVLKANPKTIVVLMGGGGLDVSEWVNQTPGIIQAWYPGMEGGNALAKILFGEVNPSGKLPMTFPKKQEDVPAEKLGEYPGKNGVEHYNDDIFVGYRYYDTYNVEPQFAFGHGLSYTTFKYSGLNIQPGKVATVKLTVRNTGSVAGAEVVQLYVSKEKSAIKRAAQELKGFQKVFLKAGESKQVTLTLPADAFKYYSEAKKEWATEPGKYDVSVGSSSRDLRLKGTILK